MSERESLFLSKAIQGLEGATSEYLNRRYDNCANRCYYACFHAAIHALQAAGVARRGSQWSHSFVPAQFDGQLIGRRHLYPPELRGILGRNLAVRLRADYDEDVVAQIEAERALRRSRLFVTVVQEGGERR
jgi:uncharacterized protein (UPF0332 family)